MNLTQFQLKTLEKVKAGLPIYGKNFFRSLKSLERRGLVKKLRGKWVYTPRDPI